MSDAPLPPPKQKGKDRTAHEGYALFVCEDDEWVLAKLYGKNREKRATSDAKLSLLPGSVAGVLLIQQYVVEQTQALQRKLIMDVIKTGQKVPPRPDMSQPIFAETSTTRKPRPEAPPPIGGVEPTWAKPTRQEVAQAEYERSQKEAAGSMTAGMRLMLIGSVGVIAGVIGPIIMFSHLADHGGDAQNGGVLITAAGIFLACIASVAFAAARVHANRNQERALPTWAPPYSVVTDALAEAAEEAGPELIAARRAALLQFLTGCLSDARYAQFLQKAKTDAAHRHVVRLFITGCAQSCLSSLPKASRPKLADLAAEAIETVGGDPMEQHDFMSNLEEHCRAEKSASLLRAGREAMTYFLDTGGYDIQWLPSLLESSLQSDSRPGSTAAEPPPAEIEGVQELAILCIDVTHTASSNGGLSEGTIAAMIEQHTFIIGMALQRHSGHPVPHNGAGMMAVFPRISQAIAGAAAIQRDVADRNELAFDNPLSIRLGLSGGGGEPSDTEYFAVLVDAAARLCATASPGTVLLPAALTKLPGSDAFAFSDPFLPPPNVLPDGEAVCQLLGALPPAAPVTEPLAIQPPAAE